jgi:Domain of unknown function (DUF222)
LHPDIARLAQAIYETIRGQCPDADPDDDGFRDRDLRMGTTLGGARRVKGDLSAQCAALLAQVFAAFGKNAGPDDLRVPGQRNHDALELALRLAVGTPGIPGNSGMKTRAQAVISLADLLAMDGASVVQEAWLAARAGEPGWFCGPAARATACAAQVTPVVTGTPDWNVLGDPAGVELAQRGREGPPHLPGNAKCRASPVGGVAHEDHRTAVGDHHAGVAVWAAAAGLAPLGDLDAGIAGISAIAGLAPRGDLDAGVTRCSAIAGLPPRGGLYASLHWPLATFSMNSRDALGVIASV